MEPLQYLVAITSPIAFGIIFSRFFYGACSAYAISKSVYFATGINLYLVMVGVLIWAFNVAGFRVDQSGLFWFQAILVLSMVMIVFDSCLTPHQPQILRFSDLVKGDNIPILAALAIVVLISVYQGLNLPAFGWDGLSYWFEAAKLWIERSPDSSAAELQAYNHRHPPTLVIAAATAVWRVEGVGHFGMVNWFWLIPLITVGLAFYGFAVTLGLRRKVAVVVSAIGTLIPVIENHALISGYAELFIMSSILLACIWIYTGLATNNHAYLLFGSLICVLPIFLKNTGIFYSAIPVVTMILTVFCTDLKNKYSVAGVLLLGGVSIVIVIHGITVFGNSFGLDDDGVLEFAGYKLWLRATSLREIVENHKQAIFYNSSYGVVGTLYVILMTQLRPLDRIRRGFTFIMLTITLGLLVMAATQFTQYGYAHSTPSSDTGYSRFIMPFATLVLLACIDNVSQLSIRKPFSTLVPG